MEDLYILHDTFDAKNHFCLSTQVIKHKLCRCSGRKHQHNNNDQGTVLSLDDVKCHVSNFH